MSEEAKNGGADSTGAIEPGTKAGAKAPEIVRTGARTEPVKASERAERAAVPRGRGPEFIRHQDQAVHSGDDEDESNVSRVRQAAGERADALRAGAAELYEGAASRVGEAYERGAEWASERYERGARYADIARRRSMESLRSGGGAVQRFAHENPLLVGVIGLAAGLVIGSLLPRTRREDRTFGRYADEARESSLRYAREAARRGREYVEEQFTDGDPRFAHHESELKTLRESPESERTGPSGRFQNH